MKPLTYTRRLVLQGYLNIIETAPPNGRLVHYKLQKITSLRLLLALNYDMSPEMEADVKAVIRRLYNEANQSNSKEDGDLY